VSNVATFALWSAAEDLRCSVSRNSLWRISQPKHRYAVFEVERWFSREALSRKLRNNLSKAASGVFRDLFCHSVNVILEHHCGPHDAIIPSMNLATGQESFSATGPHQ
jgi:hypothetical protein